VDGRDCGAVWRSVIPNVSLSSAIVLAVAHDGACARRDRQPPFEGGNLLGDDFAASIARPETAAVGAGAETLSPVSARHHGTCDQEHSRLVRRSRSHEKRRDGLVASAHQNDGIHRWRADHFLDVHRHQLRNIMLVGLRKTSPSEVDGEGEQATRPPPITPRFDRLQEFGEVAGGNC